MELPTELTGEGIVIAILDSGIHKQHSAFNKKTTDLVDSEEDKFGHGTCCAGIAAGVRFTTHQTTGRKRKIVYYGGVAPCAKLLIYKVCYKNNKANGGKVKEALKDILDNRKCDIVSMSFELDDIKPDVLKEIRQTIDDLSHEGIICVASAGNKDSKPVSCPANFGNAIAVGSHNRYGTPSEFSAKGEEVFCFAPGENIVAPTINSEGQIYFKDKALCCHSGTSYATPAVAGLIALIIQSLKQSGLHNLVNFTAIQKILKAMRDI